MLIETWRESWNMSLCQSGGPHMLWSNQTQTIQPILIYFLFNYTRYLKIKWIVVCQYRITLASNKLKPTYYIKEKFKSNMDDWIFHDDYVSKSNGVHPKEREMLVWFSLHYQLQIAAQCREWDLDTISALIVKDCGKLNL